VLEAAAEVDHVGVMMFLASVSRVVVDVAIPREAPLAVVPEDRA
jgi:hypothetical protein